MQSIHLTFFAFAFLSNSQTLNWIHTRRGTRLNDVKYADKVRGSPKISPSCTTTFVRNKLESSLKTPKVECKNKSQKLEAKAEVQEIPPEMLLKSKKTSPASDPEKKQKHIAPNNVYHKYNDQIPKEEIKEENSITFHNAAEQTEESSKAFIESIGSWINDFFSGSNKIIDSDMKPEKVDSQKEKVMEHAEYIKLLTAIKKKYQEKLKNETSVHVSISETPFNLDFERNLTSENKKSKSLIFSKSSPNLKESSDEFFETLKFLEDQEDLNVHNRGLAVRSDDPFEDLIPLNNSKSLLVNMKKKQRSKGTGNKAYKEYVIPTPDHSQMMLLNVQDQDKGLHLLKNSYFGVQESQHYGQGKKITNQVNTRCYTTKANPKDNLDLSSSETSRKYSQFCTSQASKIKGVEEVLSKNSMDIKKYIAQRSVTGNDMKRESMSFTKMKNNKSSINFQTENLKAQNKPLSDELVKYMMKKIKTNPPVNQLKKKLTLRPTESLNSQTQKYKIKRSATNNLVLKIAAKPDLQMSLTIDSRALPENKLLGSKDIQVKYPDNLRFDVSRAISTSKFNKCSYFADCGRVEDDRYLLERNIHKNARRFNDIFSKRNDKKVNEKHKRDNCLLSSKIEFMTRPKQKEVKKETSQSQAEDVEGIELSELQMARFKKQHELFKTSFKAPEHPLELELNPPEVKVEKQPDESNLSLLPAEFTDSRTALEFPPKEESEIIKATPIASSPRELDLPVAKKSLHLKVEKKITEKPFLAKSKGYKIKSSILLKEEPKALFNIITESGNTESKNQKDSPRNIESSLSTAEMRSAKTSDTALFNRRYSTKTLSENSPRNKQTILSASPVETNLCLIGENSNSKEAKEKKPKSPKSELQETNESKGRKEDFKILK